MLLPLTDNGVDFGMKAIIGIIKTVLLTAFAVLIAAAGCFVAVFYTADSPDDIYIFGYAAVIDGGNVWVVQKTEPSQTETGDGVVYYDGESYKEAFALIDDYDQHCYRSAEDLFTEVEPVQLAGKIIAKWNKATFTAI